MNVTAALASIEDVAACAARVDDQVRAVLGRVMAQRRSVETAFAYCAALAPGTRANCWALAETAGHEGWGRMQALLRSYAWDWKDLRAELPPLAAAWLPDRDGDLIGPGIAIDETAHLKKGDSTACVAPQHAGCTGKVENCVTTVFSAYVTASGQAWADFDIYMPKRWAEDPPRRDAAGIPGDLAFATKPQLAIAQVKRLAAAALPLQWAAADEVYGRSGAFRKACRDCGLAYVVIIPCDYPVTLASGTVIRADAAIADAVFERRSCGTGSKGPRISDWALTATAGPRQALLIRRLVSRPDQHTFYLCWAPQDRPATITYFITIAGRRWPVEETFKTGKDVLGWDQSQVRTWDGICRHTALTALAQLRQTAIRNALHGAIAPSGNDADSPAPAADPDHADLRFPLGDAPVPVLGGQPCPSRIAAIKLSVAETARLTALAALHVAGLITRARAAFALRWSLRRRQHQATARWHHHSTRLLAALLTPAWTERRSHDVTGSPPPRHHAERQRDHTSENRDCNIWNTGYMGQPETMAEPLARIEAACRDVGRDPATLGITALIGLWFPELKAKKPSFFDSPLTGTAQEIAAAMRGYAELGVRHIMFQCEPYTPEARKRLTAALHLYRDTGGRNS